MWLPLEAQSEMIGLVVMVLICAAVAWLASVYVGKVWGIAIGVLTFVVLAKATQRQGTTGLFRSNLKAYFRFRSAGQSVDKALHSMIASRYPFSEERRQIIAVMVSAIPQEAPEKEKVAAVVYTIFCEEWRDRPSDRVLAYRQIGEMYSELARQHRLPQ